MERQEQEFERIQRFSPYPYSKMDDNELVEDSIENEPDNKFMYRNYRMQSPYSTSRNNFYF